MRVCGRLAAFTENELMAEHSRLVLNSEACPTFTEDVLKLAAVELMRAA